MTNGNMKHLGHDVDELLEAVQLADTASYLFECGEGCGSFDNAVFEQDDVPQCPRCGSADVATNEGLVEHVMMIAETSSEGVYSNAMCEAKAEREAEL